MVELQHGQEPRPLRDYRQRHSGRSWGDTAFEPVRPVVRRQLSAEQAGLCAYCESALSADAGHLDHIKSRKHYPTLVFVYTNLAQSCNGPGHCGHHKSDRVLPVEPRADCNLFFALTALDGRLDPASGLTPDETERAKETRDILGLNLPRLTWQRKQWADSTRALTNPADIVEFLASAPFRWSLRGLIP